MNLTKESDMDISLRDYLAGQALQGLVAHDPITESYEDIYAKRAYMLADEMLKARDVADK